MENFAKPSYYCDVIIYEQKYEMKLTPIALEQIDKLETRLKLALLFRVTERRVSQMIKANLDNGKLTTAAALKVIANETGLRQSEILEDTKVKSKAA